MVRREALIIRTSTVSVTNLDQGCQRDVGGNGGGDVLMGLDKKDFKKKMRRKLPAPGDRDGKD